MANGPKMKLAVLTSGGDSAGMNAVVRAVVKTAIIKYAYSFVLCALRTNQPAWSVQGMRDMDRP